MLSDGDIQRVVRRIVEGCRPIAVGTFGSYAVGLAHENSDLDMFVIQQTALPKPARRRDVCRHLFGVMHPLDIHVFTPGEFEAEAKEELSFAWILARQARLYHWSPEAEVLVPALGAAAHFESATVTES